ncbi:MAG: putative metal-binding motif-containing protein [Alphaproteobacteria bacterium]|nr:putative metal-binding motif-containing protein [Alphaproteobacteria bacterium]
MWMFLLSLASAGSVPSADADGDGYCPTGQDLDANGLCETTAELAAPSDCNDNNPSINPSVLENTFARCSDNVNNDCDATTDQGEASCAAWADNDNDGYCEHASNCIDSTPGDCNDTNASINPSVLENTFARCSDNVNNDCDGQTDQQESSCAAWADNDNDGYCEHASNCIDSTPGDCNDASSAMFPGNDENTAAKCSDGLDNDCDTTTDLAEASCAVFTDDDGDGYCERSACADGSSPNDCDDADPAESPGLTETPIGACTDGKDNDCDGAIDLSDSVCRNARDQDGDTWCPGGRDTSGDGWCLTGETGGAGDCNDNNPAVNPGATEIPSDGVDQDCNGSELCYADFDGDDHGDPNNPLFSNNLNCNQPNESWDGLDCDDTDPNVGPGNTEQPLDGVDQDCDGWELCYEDADQDGYGGPAGNIVLAQSVACDSNGGSTNTWDCDDTDALTHPGAVEQPGDGVDQSCDGSEVCYVDLDGDGDGSDSGATVISADLDCLDGSEAATGTDCDDGDASIYGGAPEVANDGVDQDCNGFDLTACFEDLDGDRVGSGVTIYSSDEDCLDPGESYASTDCDDSDATVHPAFSTPDESGTAAPEICDGQDNDCDGGVDEDGIPTWYADDDGDGYGDPAAPVTQCEAPPGHVLDATDCDDQDASRNPGASEVCDGADDDCDGVADDGVQTQYHRDLDGDGFGDPNAVVAACSQPGGYLIDASDCNDADAADHPGADETCDGEDDDCDGSVDEGLAVPWYADDDGDGFGDPAVVQMACARPSGFVADDTDCADTANTVYPGAPELCDALDNDCNLLVDDDTQPVPWFVDADGDGHGDPTSAVVESCAPVPGHVADSTDCDDGDPAISPSEPEVCNGVDDDCTGVADDGIPVSDWYPDDDGDGYGLLAGEVQACGAPSGHVALAGDCDDLDADVSPLATEVCNGIDDDCDALIDAADPNVVLTTLYRDEDGDGYGTGIPFEICGDAGYAPNDTDCDDSDPDAYPGAPEVGGDGVDQDCDGEDALDPTLDSDGDDVPDRVELLLGMDPLDPGGDAPGQPPEPAFGCGCGSTGHSESAVLLLLGLVARRRSPGAAQRR